MFEMKFNMYSFDNNYYKLAKVFVEYFVLLIYRANVLKNTTYNFIMNGA